VKEVLETQAPIDRESGEESFAPPPPKYARLFVDGAYYPFSSVFFYADRSGFLLNGRINNLEYGSYAPGSPSVFIDNDKFVQLWSSSECYYLVADGARVEALGRLAAPRGLHMLEASGGKFLFSNHPFGGGPSATPAAPRLSASGAPKGPSLHALGWSTETEDQRVPW
jgi:hypothetical protein